MHYLENMIHVAARIISSLRMDALPSSWVLGVPLSTELVMNLVQDNFM